VYLIQEQKISVDLFNFFIEQLIPEDKV